jgi:hypothetical protein
VGERKLAKATAAPTGNGKRKRRDQVVAQGRR